MPKGEIVCTGKKITTNIIHETHKALRKKDVGDSIKLTTDTYEPIESDVKAWCRMAGHKFVSLDKKEGKQTFTIKKGKGKKGSRKVAMVISSKGLGELLSLAFPLSAALSGDEVHIFIQGPAVKALKPGFTPNLSGTMMPFSIFARKQLTSDGHAHPQEKLKQILDLGGKLYVCGPSMDTFGVKRDEIILKEFVVAEYFTFMEQMEDADVHIYN